ncbi:MAG: hypothetical protein ACK4I0_02435 [Brevundimonas sp.]|uniref:hypothetical protein n=1 Tax=Brevundimonas sp. TaxID=1871086 RepID=UPI00391C396F
MIEMMRHPRAPWHLWLVGVLSLLWNAFGAWDFIQTTTRGEAYMRAMGMSEDMIAYYEALPAWMYGPWILGVWGAVLGSILLMARSRWAVVALALSFLGALISLIYGKLVDPPPAPPVGMEVTEWMPYGILLIAALLLWYALAMAKRGVLR